MLLSTKPMKYLSTQTILVLCGWLLITNLHAQGLDIEISARLEQQSVPLNRDVVLLVEMRWKGEADQVEFLVNPEPQVTNLQLRGSGSANKFFQDEQGESWTLRQITYYYLPQNLGMAYIEPMNLKYRNEVDGQTGTLTTQRLMVRISDPVPTAETSQPWQKWILFLFLVSGLAVVFFFFRRYQQINRQRQLTVQPTEPTVKEKLRSEIRAVNLGDRSDLSHALDKLYSLFLKVLSDLYLLDPKQNSDEWLEQLHACGIEPTFLNQFKNQVDQIELSRFAGEKADQGQLHLFADSVVYLIEQAKTD